MESTRMSNASDFRTGMASQGVSLIDQASVIAEQIATIRSQLEIREAEAKESGKPLDLTWRAKAKYALRMFGIEHQKVLQEVGKEERKKRQQDDSWERSFVIVAKRLLQPGVYKVIADDARKEMGE